MKVAAKKIHPKHIFRRSAIHRYLEHSPKSNAL
ncbi:hypothetical protein [Sphingobacterium daejeonense]